MEPKWIVTIKLPRNPAHNPRDKKAGYCPVHDDICTDITGEHHSFLVNDEELLQFDAIEGLHITRVEKAMVIRPGQLKFIIGKVNDANNNRR